MPEFLPKVAQSFILPVLIGMFFLESFVSWRDPTQAWKLQSCDLCLLKKPFLKIDHKTRVNREKLKRVLKIDKSVTL